MCTIVKLIDEVEIIEKDITIYKIVIDPKGKFNDLFYSPMRGFEILLNSTYYASITKSSRVYNVEDCEAFDAIEKEDALIAITNIPAVEIQQGFHSFLNINRCREAIKRMPYKYKNLKILILKPILRICL